MRMTIGRNTHLLSWNISFSTYWYTISTSNGSSNYLTRINLWFLCVWKAEADWPNCNLLVYVSITTQWLQFMYITRNDYLGLLWDEYFVYTNIHKGRILRWLMTHSKCMVSLCDITGMPWKYTLNTITNDIMETRQIGWGLFRYHC